MVNWSQRARADLKAVHDYIAKDSLQNAKAVAREIRRRADGIETAPLGGRCNRQPIGCSSATAGADGSVFPRRALPRVGTAEVNHVRSSLFILLGLETRG